MSKHKRKQSEAMHSRYGLTEDEALAQLMIAERIFGGEQRRSEYRRILSKVRQLGYHDGGEDERFAEDSAS